MDYGPLDVTGMTASPNVFAIWGFMPTKAEPGDIWMGRDGNCYEYIAMYVDNLAIASMDPKGNREMLMNT
jgi:hypothetical protein